VSHTAAPPKHTPPDDGTTTTDGVVDNGDAIEGGTIVDDATVSRRGSVGAAPLPCSRVVDRAVGVDEQAVNNTATPRSAAL
jgi:hypothetical protein